MERFMELYQTVYKDLYRLAYYYMGNAQDAEDVVQDATLSAYEHFGRLRTEEAFRPWIFKILVNHCRRYGRKRKLRERSMEQLPEEPFEAEHSSRTEIEELLSSLSEEERLIVTLTVFGGYKGEEIARILQKNHSTIRSKYRRALKKLEARYRQEVRE